VKTKLARAVLCLVLAEQYEWQDVNGGSATEFAKLMGLDPTLCDNYSRYDNDLRRRIAKDADGAIALQARILELFARSSALSMDTRFVAFAALVSKTKDVQGLVRAGMTTTFLNVINASTQDELPEAIRDVLENPPTHWQPPPCGNAVGVDVDDGTEDRLPEPPTPAEPVQPASSTAQPEAPKYSRLAEAMRIAP